MIKEEKNLCESCENVEYRTLKNEKGEEVRAFQCPYAETHCYKIEECSNYSHPNGFQRFLRNKLAVTFLSLIIILGLVLAIVLLI